MGYLIAKPLHKTFAFFPRRLYNGDWIFWTTVYHRKIYTGEVRGLLEPPATENQYYTPEEATSMKLRGKSDD